MRNLLRVDHVVRTQDAVGTNGVSIRHLSEKNWRRILINEEFYHRPDIMIDRSYGRLHRPTPGVPDCCLTAKCASVLLLTKRSICVSEVRWGWWVVRGEEGVDMWGLIYGFVHSVF